MCAPCPHGGQRFTQRLVWCDRDERSQPLAVDRLVPLALRYLENVLEVNVGGEASGLVDDGEAGEPGVGTRVVELVEGDVLGDGDELVRAENHAADLGFVEGQSAGEELVLVGARGTACSPSRRWR